MCIIKMCIYSLSNMQNQNWLLHKFPSDTYFQLFKICELVNVLKSLIYSLLYTIISCINSNLYSNTNGLQSHVSKQNRIANPEKSQSHFQQVFKYWFSCKHCCLKTKVYFHPQRFRTN